MRKWFTSCVLPGVWEVFASLEFPVRALISEDLPTLERPMKANSGSFRAGFCSTFVLLPENMAVLIFMVTLVFRHKGTNYFNNLG